MHDAILEKLNEIEKSENIRIIYAVESGSRAWGFASEDSDYDVRFIYVRKAEDYLCIFPKKNTIEWQRDDTFDISGWDVQKAIMLLFKSNPSLCEWAGSPIVYKRTAEWDMMNKALHTNFSPKALVMHYISMANYNYIPCGSISIKKYLYTLRALLAARWAAQNHSMPPIVFSELAEAMLPESLRPHVAELLRQKTSRSEAACSERVPALDKFIAEEFDSLAGLAANIPASAPAKKEHMDILFRDITSMEK